MLGHCPAQLLAYTAYPNGVKGGTRGARIRNEIMETKDRIRLLGESQDGWKTKVIQRDENLTQYSRIPAGRDISRRGLRGVEKHMISVTVENAPEQALKSAARRTEESQAW